MGVAVTNRQHHPLLDPHWVEEVAHRALRHLGLEGKELSVVLLDDEGIAELNRRWLKRDRPTNVIAFPMDGPQDFVLGDIVISTETAQREAAERGVELREHVALLLIHGLLHLLGYDHEADPQQEARMRAKEEELLRAVLP